MGILSVGDSDWVERNPEVRTVDSTGLRTAKTARIAPVHENPGTWGKAQLVAEPTVPEKQSIQRPTRLSPKSGSVTPSPGC